MNTRMRFTSKVFSHIPKKKDTPESSVVLFVFVTRRVSTVIIFSEGG